MENVGEDKVVYRFVLQIQILSFTCCIFDNTYPNVHFERNLIDRNPFYCDYPYVILIVMFNLGSNLFHTKLLQIGSDPDLVPSALYLIKSFSQVNIL